MTQDGELEKLLTLREVAEYLNVSVSTIRRWDNRGYIKGYRVGPRKDRRYRLKDILNLPEENTNGLQSKIQESS